jgi:hypothetical protein
MKKIRQVWMIKGTAIKHDVQGVAQDHLALEGEDQDQRQQQAADGDVVELGDERLVEVLFAPCS